MCLTGIYSNFFGLFLHIAATFHLSNKQLKLYNHIFLLPDALVKGVRRLSRINFQSCKCSCFDS